MIEIKGVSKSFPQNYQEENLSILNHISLNIQDKEFVSSGGSFRDAEIHLTANSGRASEAG